MVDVGFKIFFFIYTFFVFCLFVIVVFSVVMNDDTLDEIRGIISKKILSLFKK